MSRSFTPRATAALEPAVQRTADALLDALELTQRARSTSSSTYAAQLPVLVIADLLGVPHRAPGGLPPVGRGGGGHARPRAARSAGTRPPSARCGPCTSSCGSTSTRLRREPGDDLVSRLVGLPDEEALTERELHATVMLLLGRRVRDDR